MKVIPESRGRLDYAHALRVVHVVHFSDNCYHLVTKSIRLKYIVWPERKVLLCSVTSDLLCKLG